MNASWLYSKKMWTIILTVWAFISAKAFGVEFDPGEVAGLFVALIAYLTGQSVVDSKKATK